MPITIDDQKLAPDDFGFTTVGQVLGHLQRNNRLVVNVTLNGEAPDLDRMGELRAQSLDGNELYIETVDPTEMAMSVLDEVEQQLAGTDRARLEAADLLQSDRTVKAMEKLAGCFGIWQHAQQSLLQTARLMGVDLSLLNVEGRPIVEFLQGFSAHLRTIRDALEGRDFVLLGDVLTYEMGDSARLWFVAVQSLRDAITTPSTPLRAVA